MKSNIFKILVLLVLIIMVTSTFSFAEDKLGLGNLDDYGKIDTSNGSKIAEKAGVILGYIQLIGMVLSIIVLIILGIKYMVGSVEQKAYFKESLKPYIIGVVILFAATSLPKFIYEIVNSMIK